MENVSNILQEESVSREHITNNEEEEKITNKSRQNILLEFLVFAKEKNGKFTQHLPCLFGVHYPRCSHIDNI